MPWEHTGDLLSCGTAQPPCQPWLVTSRVATTLFKHRHSNTHEWPLAKSSTPSRHFPRRLPPPVYHLNGLTRLPRARLHLSLCHSHRDYSVNVWSLTACVLRPCSSMRSLLSFLPHRAEKTEVLSDDLLQVRQSLTWLSSSGQFRAAAVVRVFVRP